VKVGTDRTRSRVYGSVLQKVLYVIMKVQRLAGRD